MRCVQSGVGGRAAAAAAAVENTESEFVKSRLHNYQSEQPCEDCKVKTVKSRAALVVKVGEDIQEVTALTISSPWISLRRSQLDEEGQIALPVLKEKALSSCGNDVGLGYPSLDRRDGVALQCELRAAFAWRRRLGVRLGEARRMCSMSRRSACISAIMIA